jgi:AAA domain
MQTTSSVQKADAIRRIRSMVVTAQGDENEKPERILLDWNSKSPAQMLAEYQKYMSTYSTLCIDPAGDMVRLYDGEWSIWSGFPGTGKTTLIRQNICHWLKSDPKSVGFVATLEQDPEHYIIELAGVAAGVEIPNEAQLTKFLDLYGNRLKVWGMVGMAEHKKILATIRTLADTIGLKFAVIDSLMAMDVPANDNEEQRHFVNLLSATARAKRVHLHLVAHPRKPLAPDQEPNTWDVAGSSDLGRMAFNVFFIRRGPELTGSTTITNMLLHVLKQRVRGRIGEIEGFFNREQRQFHLDPNATRPTEYLSADQYLPDGMNDEIPAHIMNPSAFRVERAPVGQATEKETWEW